MNAIDLSNLKFWMNFFYKIFIYFSFVINFYNEFKESVLLLTL